MHKVNYVKVEMWADELGNRIQCFLPAGSYNAARGSEGMGEDSPKPVFTGTTLIKVQVPGQQPRQQPMNFQYPETVTDVQAAWEMFEKLSDDALKDMQAKANVVPAHTMPKIVGPNGKPFIGPDGKPIGG